MEPSDPTKGLCTSVSVQDVCLPSLSPLRPLPWHLPFTSFFLPWPSSAPHTPRPQTPAHAGPPPTRGALRAWQLALRQGRLSVYLWVLTPQLDDKRQERRIGTYMFALGGLARGLEGQQVGVGVAVLLGPVVSRTYPPLGLCFSLTDQRKYFPRTVVRSWRAVAESPGLLFDSPPCLLPKSIHQGILRTPPHNPPWARPRPTTPSRPAWSRSP